MDARLWTAAMVVAGCAWLMPTPAHAQIASREFRLDPRVVIGPSAARSHDAMALPHTAASRPSQPAGLMQSWELQGGARFGLGRYSVTQIARPRTGFEREYLPTERRASSVAGAGVRLAF